MTTIESPTVRLLFERIHVFEPHAQFGGSVPNLATELRHSYHRSFDDSPHDKGYSVSYYGDRSPIVLVNKKHYASALDITFSETTDMQKYTARFHHLAMRNGPLNLSHGLREFAGTLDGKNVFAMDTTRNVETFGWDHSHLWHIHLSFNRRFVLSKRILELAKLFD
jgi:hypothetical protein